MLSEAIEKRVNEMNTICAELPLVVANHGWSDYALELVKKLQRLAIALDDEEDSDDDADEIASDIIRYKRLRPQPPADERSGDGGVGVYVVRDGKLLAATRLTTTGFNRLCGPGGLVERGESPRDAAVRETREEFGIEPTELIQFGTGEKGGNGIAPVLFLCTSFNGEPKCDEVEMTRPVWKSIAELEKEPNILYAPFRDGVQRLKEAVSK